MCCCVLMIVMRLLCMCDSGRNNQFHITTMSDLATTYNDLSVLENFHCAETFALGNSPDCCLFEQLSNADYTRFRKVVVNMILGTVRLWLWLRLKLVLALALTQ